MKSFFCCFLLTAIPFIASAQGSYQNYDWATQPTLHPIPALVQGNSAIIIKDVHVLEYTYGKEDEALYCYKTTHRIVRVNDDAAVEGFNKVFVPMNDVVDFTTLKARAITPSGKVVELNRDNIKELENVGDIGALKIFAIEGVEKGGEVEYLYTTKIAVSEPYGSEIIQSDVPVLLASMKIISPANLEFEAKGYNGFPDFKAELTPDSLRILSASLENIAPLLEEQYANYRANLMQVNYKIAYNNGGGKVSKRLYNWNMAAVSFGELVYGYNDEAKKKVNKILKSLKISKLKDSDKIIAIENYLKTNIAIEQASGNEFRNVEEILVNKHANELGIVRVYAAFLEEAHIPNEILVTCERSRANFDKDFEAWNQFTDILFYFPANKTYLSPAQRHFRCGMAPYQFGGNYGLFINRMGINRVKKIEFSPAQNNMNLLEATLKFDNNFAATMTSKQSWTGYRAAEFRAIYEFQQDDFVKDRLKSEIEDAEVKTFSVKNGKINDSSQPNLPFAIEGELDVASLVEKAGNNYLFKIGEIIGAQVEMYQEHARQQPIDMQYPIFYRRIIQFNIPQGYVLKGADDIKIDKSVLENDQITSRFISDYVVKGNQVTVTADEFYENVSLPPSLYEPFRSVINAAADFNKVVLVFEKE
jgi:hypothetical protein